MSKHRLLLLYRQLIATRRSGGSAVVNARVTTSGAYRVTTSGAYRVWTAGVDLPDVASATRLLDIRASALVLSDGDPAATWANAGTAGGSFTRGAGSVAVKKQTDGDGDPYVDWGSVFLDPNLMTGANVANNLASFTVFAVTSNWDGPVISKIGNDNCEDPGSTGWITYNNSITLYTDTSNNIYQTGSANQTKHLTTYEDVSTGELHVYENGVLNDQNAGGGSVAGSGISSYSNTEPLRLGQDGSSQDCDPAARGKLYAIRIYAPAPNASDRAAIEADMAADTGVTL